MTRLIWVFFFKLCISLVGIILLYIIFSLIKNVILLSAENVHKIIFIRCFFNTNECILKADFSKPNFLIYTRFSIDKNYYLLFDYPNIQLGIFPNAVSTQFGKKKIAKHVFMVLTSNCVQLLADSKTDECF